jgi:phytanoyl-CoA hydroxylase
MSPGKLRASIGLKDENVEYERRVIEAHSAPWYTAFAHHPVLTDFVKKFSGWEDTTLLKRSLFRPNVPGGEATYVHYDQIFLRAGPPTALTAWVPLGDCAINGGGLLYLEDSVSLGMDLEKGFAEAAKDFTDEERLSAFNAAMMENGFLEKDSGKFSKLWGRKWLAADYEAGDVVLHSSFNIHCSAVNETNVIRLATDLRFVETGKPFDHRWMKTWEVSYPNRDRDQTY